MGSTLPSLNFVWIPTEGGICREDYPVGLISQRVQPIHVGGIALEAFPQMNCRVFGFEKTMKGSGNAWRKNVVQKEPHAASAISNSIASRTESGSSSYQSEISSTLWPAFDAARKTSVATPAAAVIG